MTKNRFTIALAGNANVGKSVIFNQLTGLHQHIGNWPGKTVEKAVGTLHFKTHSIDVLDLPGIYSLSTFSIEEVISREYIAIEKPDLVINVVDASILERNLFFTLQLLELETPMIVALNQMDMAKKKGIHIDSEKLGKLLGILVVPTVAVSGSGIYELLETAVAIMTKKVTTKPLKPKYGKEIEARIEKLERLLDKSRLKYPTRWVALKLLEEDKEVKREIHAEVASSTVLTAEKLGKEVEKIHAHSCQTVIASERYELANRIAQEVRKITPPIKPQITERIHTLTTHRIVGYPLMALIVLSIFFFIFTFGDYTSSLLGDTLFNLESAFESMFEAGALRKLVGHWVVEGYTGGVTTTLHPIPSEIVWNGVVEGIKGGVTVALPYILPFYLILYLLEDSGYLSRIAFLMDNFMHKIGLHGKAFIPIMLGFGCNVPGCLGCRIMETRREKFLTAFVVTLVPCAATTVIILGLVGAFVSIQWALALYVLNLLVIFLLGRLAFKALPDEPTALIMEMNDYKIPHLETVAKQTWFRVSEFIKMALPLIIVGSLAIKMIELLGLLESAANILSPLTVTWLGLPAITGITLIFGVLRKEMTLIMLATLIGTSDFAQVLTPIQMVVFTIVAMFYIPCIATIAALLQEFGWKRTVLITIFEILLALLLGGIAFRILPTFLHV